MNEEEKNFWDLFKAWTLNDINICFKNRANIATVILICCAIDAFGSFYIGRGFMGKENLVRPSGGSGGSKPEEAGSRNAFVAFASNYIPEAKGFVIKLGTKKKNGTEFLYDNFRNGLIHGAIPHGGVGIVRKRDRKIFVGVSQYGYLINIRPFKTALRRAVEQYDRDLRDSKQPERLVRWRDRYRFLQLFNLKHFR